MKERCRQVMQQLDGNACRAMEKAARLLEEAVRGKILHGYGDGLVDSGTLERSVAAEWEKTAEGQYMVRVGIPADHEAAAYAAYVHNGTHRMAGRPFLADGVLGAMNDIRGLLENELFEGMGG